MTFTRRDLVQGGFAMGLSVVLPTDRAAATTAVIGGRIFGSTWRLSAARPISSSSHSQIRRRLSQVDALMSPYRASSTLSLFNRAGIGVAVEVPEMMADVVNAALATAHTTQGAFDPTLGPLTHRYGFGPIEGQPGRLAHLGWDGQSLRKMVQDTTLDLCGIAKGHALDLVFDDLRAAGVMDFVLELGGEVRAAGSHPSGRAWQIAVEAPTDAHFSAHCIVAPGDLALATSGHQTNGLTGDIAFSHVMDSARGRPVAQDFSSVSVLSDTGMASDALATALLAMGDGGPSFAQQNGISALFIPPANQPSIMTGRFDDHVVA